MSSKILIIEDLEEDYLTVKKVLSKYDVEVFPKTVAEWKEFSKLLTRYAKLLKTEDLELIKTQIARARPDFAFIDISLNYNVSGDHTGLELKKLIDKEFPLAVQFIISLYKKEDFPEKDLKSDGWIHKRKTASIPGQITNLLEKYKLARTETGNVHSPPEYYERPKSLTTIGDYEYFKISPWAAFIIEKVITYVFYLVLLSLFISGAILLKGKIIEAIKGHVDNIKVAEFVFLAFLPFVIASCFFIFYKRSLSSYFLREISDPRKEMTEFDASGSIMNLSKKLFISSLVSYLFIRMIELLSMDETHHNETSRTSFDEYYKTHSYNQIFFLGGLIVILICYYLLIDRSHNNKRDH